MKWKILLLPGFFQVLSTLLLSATDPQSMWAMDAGDTRLEGAGYKPAPGVETYPVYLAESGIGTYHHHSFLFHHDGVFYAAFSEGHDGEDGPGQRVRVATSSNGKDWDHSALAVEAFDDIFFHSIVMWKWE